MAEHRVVVDGDLRVERHHLPVLRDQQRVHLDEHRVLAHERLVELAEHRAHGPDHVVGDLRLERQLAPVEVAEAEQWVDVLDGDRAGVVLSHRLDVHAALAREHRHRLAGGAVEQDRGVVLLVDLRSLLDVKLVDGEALDVHAEDRPGVLLEFGAILRELDAAGLAAATDQHLRLHHNRVAELLTHGHGLLDGRGGLAVRHGHAVLREELLSLIFEKVHYFLFGPALAISRRL